MHTSSSPISRPALPAAGDSTGDRALTRVAQALLAGPLGALVIFGSVYFGAIAPEETLGAFDWVVGAWALAMGVASVWLAARLRSGGARAVRLAIALVSLHAAFGVLKLVAYAEPEAVTFMAVDAIVLVILLRLRAR